MNLFRRKRKSDLLFYLFLGLVVFLIFKKIESSVSISGDYKVYYGFTFILTAWTSFFFFRQIRLDPRIAGCIGILFSFLPFHFARFQEVRVFSYFLVPLQTLTLLWLYSSRSLFLEWRWNKKESLAAGVALASGFLGGFSSFFYSVLCFVGGIGGSVYRRRWTPLFSSFLLVLILYLGSLGVRSGGMSSGSHTPIESERYGFNLIPFLFPSSHHSFEWFRILRSKVITVIPILEGENESLGLVGTFGFFMLLGQFLRMRERITVLRKLATFLLFSLLVGTIAGFGSLFSLLVSSAFPYWNRVSIFMAFFSLAAVGCSIQQIFKKIEIYCFRQGVGRFAYGVEWLWILMILVLGLFDQRIKAVFP